MLIYYTPRVLNQKAQLNLFPLQPSDVPDTFADSHILEQYANYKPSTSVEHGGQKFCRMVAAILSSLRIKHKKIRQMPDFLTEN
ncbi:hypothetical protein [Acinetobacter puyangensis]|uniref:hypothetical protein n=1 Tax=Acinetobacter puyangensis TaxID=1096779 RepID=UPI003A4D4A7A